ncbi:MAG TPA: glycine--tRNA ligase [Thermoplasmata archaeon]|nr:glycine--tRNA ligase [Thermoplasmata archaeon]
MKLDELFALLRRRGVLWPTAEIYGGVQGLYDYGPLGYELKRQIEAAWRAWFVGLSEDYYSIDPAEIVPEAVVRASGHLENFTDPEVNCGNCHRSFRADTVLEASRPEGVDGLAPEAIAHLLTVLGAKCPNCGSSVLSVPRPFNLMFPLAMGAGEGERAYLRPETAQSSYLAFARMWEVGRKALPLGIAVVGRAYRNEIAPRQVLFRMRAFTQAELQIFFDPASFPVPLDSVADLKLPVVRASRRADGDDHPVPTTVASLVADGGLPEFYAFHLAHTYQFYHGVLGVPAARIRLWEKSDQERAFYNRIQFDVEVDLPSLGGFKEIGAVHYRGDYDLGRHAEGSKKDLTVAKADGSGRLLPHVLELTFGPDRALWMVADVGLGLDGERTLWRMPSHLAPVTVGVFPLIRKAHTEFATTLARQLLLAGVRVDLDTAGTIGKRYARADEAGTPFCVTVDGGTVDPASPDHGTVTLRERDSKTQRRVRPEELVPILTAAQLPPRPEPAAPASATPERD